jgi:hypothetical protein
MLDFFIMLTSSVKSKPESCHHKNKVQILSQNVFIAAFVESGVVAIASSTNVIHL